MRSLYRLFRSVKLAVALLLALTALSLASTLIPQGLESSFYFQRYAPALARLLTASGLTRLFRSWLFLLPGALLFVNLAVCTIGRVVGRLRHGQRLRLGPELVHAGLLLLLAGGLLSALERQESTFFLGRGEGVELSTGHRLRLLQCVEERYPDGRPKDWISTVEVGREGEAGLPPFAIQVNRPLRLRGALRIYQVGFRREDSALLRDSEDRLQTMRDGQYFPWEGDILYFAGIREGQAEFERWEGQALAERIRRAPAQSVGPFTIVALSSRELTGLKAVRDPGVLPVIAALGLVAAGLTLGFTGRDREAP